jgi:hypothetical protein
MATSDTLPALKHMFYKLYSSLRTAWLIYSPHYCGGCADLCRWSMHTCFAQQEALRLPLTEQHPELLRARHANHWADGPAALSTRESNRSTYSVRWELKERSDACTQV